MVSVKYNYFMSQMPSMTLSASFWRYSITHNVIFVYLLTYDSQQLPKDMQICIRNKIFIQVNRVLLCMVVLNSSDASTVKPSRACASLTFSGIANPSQLLCVKDQDTLIIEQSKSIKAVSKPCCAPPTHQVWICYCLTVGIGREKYSF